MLVTKAQTHLNVMLTSKVLKKVFNEQNYETKVFLLFNKQISSKNIPFILNYIQIIIIYFQTQFIDWIYQNILVMVDISSIQ